MAAILSGLSVLTSILRSETSNPILYFQSTLLSTLRNLVTHHALKNMLDLITFFQQDIGHVKLYNGVQDKFWKYGSWYYSYTPDVCLEET